MRDAQQRAHAELAHAVLIQNLALQAEFGRHLLGALGQQGGGEDVGGFVGQIAAEVLRFRQDAPAIHGGLRTTQHREGIHLLFVLLRIGLIAIVFQIRQDRAFHGGGHEIVGAPGLIESQRDAMDALALQRADHRASEFAQLGRIELLALSAAGQHQAFGLQARRADAGSRSRGLSLRTPRNRRAP